ncbi:DUF438 domain-containing protein [Desulfosporosinus sp. PR]|uniref:DUF438 domain-containing protein n=1 Tax=Candidatus Desulfosporosinus nitrosoreducens TaxID=3401928 RepID=UPI0027ECA852|nr:DUF438 domain-containing protein [Desulfosporosinus sp. PR]MDQ7092305.1 DUF438 domain-containing protein [Desulfosporosinus sp. PR]
MSDMINNREYRQKVLKELISELHNGKNVEDVKPRFEELIKGISAKEIAEMEQALIMDGMPVEEIQNLCDVHAAVFKGSIAEIHQPEKPEAIPGHPVYIFKKENREIEKLLNEKVKPNLEKLKHPDNMKNTDILLENINRLSEIDKHYSRKENLLFPYLEKYGITAPPKVMWGVDDEIRDAIKALKTLLSSDGIKDEVMGKAQELVNRVQEMIFKEENILFPMALETLTEDEWLNIAEESEEIGFTLIESKEEWQPITKAAKEKVKQQREQLSGNGSIAFDAGSLSPKEINAILNTLPLDITFVDKNGTVKYFSQGRERIFARTKTILGRRVENCHPPASIQIVEKIVADLKTGKKDHEDFWLKMGEKYAFIRYLAVKDEKGECLGIVEVTQDIAPIQKIAGEKRLLSDT